MVIYIDTEYKCHTASIGTMRAFDVPFFDGKCQAFIEGYRYVPPGERWVKPNGVFFLGEMIAPWKDHSLLAAQQAAYEAGQQTSSGTDEEKEDMRAALELLEVTPDG